MFSQKITNSLNQESSWYTNWSNHYADLLALIVKPYVELHSSRLANPVSIMASENQYGRFISIELSRYKWSYLLKLDNSFMTQQRIDDLLSQVLGCKGHLYLKDSFIVIDLPLGYYLDIDFGNNLFIRIMQIEYVDLDAFSHNNSNP